MRTWASLLVSAISIQQPIAWQTAVTFPSVVTCDLAYLGVSLAMLASETFALPCRGAPSFTVVLAAALPAGVFDSHAESQSSAPASPKSERARTMATVSHQIGRLPHSSA